MTHPLTLGYKASAEQFDPRELVEIAVAAEAHGMESVAPLLEMKEKKVLKDI